MQIGRAAFVAFALVLWAGAARGQRTHVLVVSGISGEPRFAEQWDAWARSLVAGLQEAGVGSADMVRLAERAGAGIAGRSTKEEIVTQLVRIAGAAGASDQILLVFFGHGAGNADGVRLNLPGPDLTARELDIMLQAFPTQRVVVVNTASASGGFVEPLAGENRVIVTATRSESQNNETIFGEYFVAAYAGDGADTDKDGRVSLLEAFTYARLEVERAYSSTNRMRSEHSLLEANGDGTPTVEAEPGVGDGRVASAIFFGRGAPSAVAGGAPADASPELRALYEHRTALQKQIDALRARSGNMPAAQYDQALEALLVDLATTNQSIRRLEGGV